MVGDKSNAPTLHLALFRQDAEVPSDCRPMANFPRLRCAQFSIGPLQICSGNVPTDEFRALFPDELEKRLRVTRWFRRSLRIETRNLHTLGATFWFGNLGRWFVPFVGGGDKVIILCRRFTQRRLSNDIRKCPLCVMKNCPHARLMVSVDGWR